MYFFLDFISISYQIPNTADLESAGGDSLQRHHEHRAECLSMYSVHTDVIYADTFRPISKQLANTLSVMCPAYTLRNRRTHVDRDEFRTACRVLLLGDRIGNLRSTT